ncbi:MAG: hypothetical protein AVDCRST_MAG18-3308, partial [uncultured Thermomicrobiales bacterium]
DPRWFGGALVRAGRPDTDQRVGNDDRARRAVRAHDASPDLRARQSDGWL